MKIIKNVDILSFAKISSIFYATIGLVIGIAFTLDTVIGYGSGSTLFDIFGIVLIPLVYWIVGFIAGAIVAFIYNFAASLVGGIRVQIEDTEAVEEK